MGARAIQAFWGRVLGFGDKTDCGQNGLWTKRTDRPFFHVPTTKRIVDKTDYIGRTTKRIVTYDKTDCPLRQNGLSLNNYSIPRNDHGGIRECRFKGILHQK